MFFRPIYVKEANLNFFNWSRLWDIGQYSYVAGRKDPIAKTIPLYLTDAKPAVSLLEKTVKIIFYGSIIVGSATITPYLLLIPAIQLAAHAIFCLANRSSFKKDHYDKEFIDKLTIWLQDSSVTGNKAEAKKRILDTFKQKYTTLNLEKLQLTSLPPIFSHLAELKWLYLNENQLTSLPAEIGQLTQLQALYLNDNQLTSLPAEIGQLTQLQALYLSNNQFTSLPAEIKQLTQLKELYLQRNRLSSLPKEIGQLTQLQLLGLSYNQLTSLPAEIGQLTQLQQLGLSYNQLTSLPAEIGQLTQLQQLGLNYNQLTSLPAEIGQLTQLQLLNLSDNQFTALPVEIGQLAQLQELYLSNNILASLPAEIGQLAQLKWFTIHNNSHLQTLSMSLGALINLTYIDTQGTAIDRLQAENLQNVWQRARASRGIIDFEVRFKFWLKTAEIEADPKTISSFTEEEKRLLNEWLLRLAKTKDYQNCQQRLAKVACEMVQSLKKLPEFKKSFFVQVENDNNRCQDRAAMSFNLLYTAWRLQTLPEASSVKEKLTLIQRAAKTEALRAYLADCIDRRQKESDSLEYESVEIYLYYETALKKKLDLLTAIDQMAYNQIGKRDWIKEKSAIQFVEKKYLSFFYKHPSLRTLALKQAQVKLEVEEAQEKAFKNLSETPSQDELSAAYLDWQMKQNKILQELEETTHAICQAWAKEQL